MVWSKANNPLENSSSTEWKHTFDTIYYASFNKQIPQVAVCGAIGPKFALEIIEIMKENELILRSVYKMDSAHEVRTVTRILLNMFTHLIPINY